MTPHADRDKSEQPTAEPHKSLPDVRLKRLLGLSRWERAGALTYILATHPEVFDEAYDALGFKVE
ncbi:hypothetical protein UB45_07700 [Terrabacter sp. 28]|uniref:hypothetical protein n=1 Tax=Pseudomonas sp. 2(2015) TaxID=1619950 RepID=UPI0005EB4CDC|nr:hypothetical protein [Pseudomonas sp. 2(2015)]KJK12146.1 hypothetical protein UB48_26900 [Pseudomonas sp. 2(2015)]KJK12553.1 hypothetical protein UB45_07700 [Terrabacter sp. 28]